MNLKQLRQRCRLRTQDGAEPYAWEDPEFDDGLNEAVTEACIRAKLISRNGVSVALVAGEAAVDNPAWMWSICRVTVGGRRMENVDREWLDARLGAQWEEATGEPSYVYESGGKLCFYPKPEAAGTALLSGFCIPEAPMAVDEDTPGIPEHFHINLIDWALRCAYLKEDAETFDESKSGKFEAEFERVFGPRPSAQTLRRLRLVVPLRTIGRYF